MTNAGLRCPAFLLLSASDALLQRRDHVRCGLIHHPGSEKHQAGAKHWEAPLSEEDLDLLARELAPLNEAKASLERRTILRAEAEEACLSAAKACALVSQGSCDPAAAEVSAIAAKAYIEAACLLRGT